jgi:hypothetical protein
MGAVVALSCGLIRMRPFRFTDIRINMEMQLADVSVYSGNELLSESRNW